MVSFLIKIKWRRIRLSKKGKKMSKKKIGWIVAIVLLGIITIVLVIGNGNGGTYVPYKQFYQEVENQKVEKAQLEEEKVNFYFKNDTNPYYTDNPQYDKFKEFLLLNEVQIEESMGMNEVYAIFDIMLYVVFIGIACFGIYKFVSFSHQNFPIIRNTQTTFADIAGMEELKKDMMQLVEVVKDPKQFQEKGIRPPKGIILEGPPGNGKTLFARAFASEANMNFIATKGADFQSAMMSIGPRKIKMLFRKARRNKPCIIFIDEFDGIGERRNYAGTGIDKENNRLIITMLNEMDGFRNEDGVLVMAATNSYASLDAALIRPGRFDRKYKIDNPDKEMILQLIDLYTKGKKLDEKVNVQELSKCFGNLSAAAIETILNEATLLAEAKGKETISIQEIAEAGKKTNTVRIIVQEPK